MDGAWIGGEPVALQAAAAAAARLLAGSRLPVIAGLGTDVAGARAAIALADRLGGVIDHLHSDALLRDLDVLREAGMMVTTPNEARLRADLILLVGPCRGLDDWPDLAARLLAGAARSQSGEGGRYVAWLRPRPVRNAGPVDDANIEYLGRDGGIGRLPAFLAALRARIAGRPLGRTAFHRRNLDRLAARLQRAKFGVAVWSAAELDPLAIEMLCGIVKDLNAGTRFTGLPLPATDNGAGVVQACGWMTGFPMRTGFARGRPEHDPWRLDARRLVEDGEADCVLWISAYGAPAPAWTRGVPTIALTSDAEVRDRAVHIRVGRPGRDHDAVEHSAVAGTLVHVAAAARSGLISVADALGLMAANLPQADARPC